MTKGRMLVFDLGLLLPRQDTPSIKNTCLSTQTMIPRHLRLQLTLGQHGFELHTSTYM